MTDKKLEQLIRAESRRQEETIDLIPSENIVSEAVLHAAGSRLINKYSEGYPLKRYYAGNAIIDSVEALAQERAKKLFRLGKDWEVNVQALSGAPANMAVYFSLLEPGDTVMGMNLTSGGHLTHGSPANFSGKLFRIASYNVKRDGWLDYAEIAKMARKEKPKMIIAGATAYPRIIDFAKFGKIARDAGAFLMVDMAHIAGLVAAGVHPSPFPYADVVTTTTHKTLRGPRGAMIFSRNTRMIKKGDKEVSISRLIDRTIFPGLQGGPHDNQTAAIATALYEALQPSFKKYGGQIVKNARALARALVSKKFDLISGGTDNHLMLIDLTSIGMAGREAQDLLEAAGIIVNRNTVPYEARSPFDPSGIRLGTPALTSRGMKEKEMKEVASLLHRTLIARENAAVIRREVRRLCARFPIRKSYA